MLQQYVPNILVVLVLCCSECFHTLQVASVLSGCCICFTHMLQVYILDISSVFVCILLSSVSCCSKSQGRRGVMVPRHSRRGIGRDELGARG
jgi:hypothetical protein